MKKKKQKGFTLAEVLVVVIIIAVMAYFAVPMYNKVVRQSDASDALHNIDMFSTAQEKFFIQNGKYTDDLGKLETPLKGEKPEIYTDKFTYSAGNPKDDDYCIYSESKTRKYTLAKNYKNHSDIFCFGQDCDIVNSFVKTGDSKLLCASAMPEQCDKTSEHCKKLNENWDLLEGCYCGCTVPEKICNKSQRWSHEKCACVQWNSCDLTEDTCKTLYTANYILEVDSSGSCECKCGLSAEICQGNNADGFDEKTCSCVCSSDDVKKCSGGNKILQSDCSCVSPKGR